MHTLTKEKVDRIFEYKDGKVYWKVTHGKAIAGKEAGWSDKLGYRHIKVQGEMYLTHHIVWLICKGELPRNTIDHIDGVVFNNHIENLRDVPHQENCKNRKINHDNKSGYMGVVWHKRDKRWRASVGYMGKLVFLGDFKNIEDAAMMALSARAQLGFHENHGQR